MNNPSDQRDYPEMDSSTRDKLRNFFRDDIRKLEQLLEQDLSHWLQK